MAEPTQPARSAKPETVDTGVLINYGTVRDRAEEVMKLIYEKNWEELSSFFSASSAIPHTASDLEALFSPLAGETVSNTETGPFVREFLTGACVLSDTESGSHFETAMRFDETLSILTIGFAARNDTVNAESSEEWEEMVITTGNLPKITGILTVPSGTEDAPVAVLFPETLTDPADASGSNADLRKDLAHKLAEHGVASVRYDTRCHEDALLTDVFGYDLDLILNEDTAAIIHSLERYPVDASRIIYVGHGTAGALGYCAVYHHYEVTGGLVLINAPYEEDGAHLFARAMWLESEHADTAREALDDEESSVIEIAGYPISYWKQWDDAGALRYTRYVSIPILILQGESDAIVTLKEDYENWKSQKGSNVTMKSYPKLGHDLRAEDGAFEELIAEDIADWLDGVDINKKKTDADKKTSGSGTAGKKS